MDDEQHDINPLHAELSWRNTNIYIASYMIIYYQDYEGDWNSTL